MQENLRVFTCIHVFKGDRATKLISNLDGDLCFLCGEVHKDTADDYLSVSLKEILKREPHLERHINLRVNAETELVNNGEWVVSPVLPED